jgi:putative DNA primase/helicase
MAKDLKIQDLAKLYCEQISEQMIYVCDRKTFYEKDEEYLYYKPLDKEKIERKVAPFLSAQLNSNITQNTFNNFLIWLRIELKSLETINIRHAILNDHNVLDLHNLSISPYKDNQIIFYHINSNTPNQTDDCPIFKKFISEIIIDSTTKETDEISINYIQEIMGYYLMSKIEPPTACFLVGDGANGKSTLLSIIKQLAGGDDFVMENSIENLTTSKFDKNELRYKRLNICEEEQSKYIKTDAFKRLIDGGTIDSDVKFADRVRFKTNCKHIFASNDMINLGTMDYALRRRFKIIYFNRKFLPHEADKSLKTNDFIQSKFYDEFPGILSWVIQGAKRLIANNYAFSNNQIIEDNLDKYEQEVSSVVMFLRENFIPSKKDDNDITVSHYGRDRLYRIYQIWSKRVGRKAVSINNFRKDLKSILNMNAQPAWDKILNKTVRGYTLKLLDESDIRLETPDYQKELTNGFQNIPNEYTQPFPIKFD